MFHLSLHSLLSSLLLFHYSLSHYCACRCSFTFVFQFYILAFEAVHRLFSSAGCGVGASTLGLPGRLGLKAGDSVRGLARGHTLVLDSVLNVLGGKELSSGTKNFYIRRFCSASCSLLVSCRFSPFNPHVFPLHFPFSLSFFWTRVFRDVYN